MIRSVGWKRVLGCAGIVGLATTVASAGTIRDDVADSTYTAIGNNAAFASSGLLTVDGDIRGGVLIRTNLTDTSSRFVLTAAHNANFAAVRKFTVGGNTYDVEQVFVHPQFAGVTRPNDIAVLKLTTAVTNVTPANVYTGTAERNQVATMVGFGATGTGLTGSQGGQGTKRGGTNVIDRYAIFNNDGSFQPTTTDGSDRTLLITDFDKPDGTTSSYGDTAPLATEYQIADKDSGSGMFATIGGTQYLVGVNVLIAGNGPAASYGYLSLATRVSSYQSFITSIVPEPSGVLLGAVAALGLLRRRRR